MGKRVFVWLTRQAIRFRAVTLIVAALVMILGVVAASQLKQELIPNIAFPQTIILIEAGGMSPQEVLNLITIPVEAALDDVEEIVNLESTTSNGFGLIIARNNFGQDQEAIQASVQNAIDGIWLPVRRLEPPSGEDPQAFARLLLADLTPEVVLYLAGQDDGFLFQLSEDVLRQFSPEVLGSLPDEVFEEMDPALEGELRASAAENVEVSHTDDPPSLPASWQTEYFQTAQDLLELASLLRPLAGIFNDFYETGRITGPLGTTADLTPDVVERVLAVAPTMVEHFQGEHLAAMPEEVFDILSPEFIAGLDSLTRNELAAAELARTFGDGDSAPPPVPLPNAWRVQPPQLRTFSFTDIPLASVSVSGDIEPDELRRLVENVIVPRVESLDSIANVSVSGGQQLPGESTDTSQNAETEVSSQNEVNSPANPSGNSGNPQNSERPEGPSLGFFWVQVGAQLGTELDTADDLMGLEVDPTSFAAGDAADLPEECADQTQSFGDFGDLGPLYPSDLFNFLALLANLAQNDPCIPVPAFLLASLLNTTPLEAIQYFVEYDPNFPAALQPVVYDYLSTEALLLPEMAPPLDTVWSTLSNRPELGDWELNTADDLIALGDGDAASVLNRLVESVPQQFAGYEVGLIDALSPTVIRYLIAVQPDFLMGLSEDVLRKMSPPTLASLPEDFLATLDQTLAEDLAAIAAGEAPSAAEALTAEQAQDAPAGDPNAPALPAAWAPVAGFVSYELDTIDDLMRTPAGTASAFLNSFLDSPQGANAAPGLINSLTPEMAAYLDEHEPGFLDDLRPEIVALFSEATLATLPEAIQARAEGAGEHFVPENTITRVNGQPSLSLTVFKTGEANTVSAFHAAEEVLREIEAEHEGIEIGFAFEQASFIEEAISGVVREGTLGAIFAVVVILIFLTNVRSTLVTAVSIPLSVMLALALMYWVPPAVHSILAPAQQNAQGLLATLLNFALRLFPESITLNIMTLSGLTVAVGRVVDDSIVVLENIYRRLQKGGDTKQAVLEGTREVSVAIFAATVTTVVVFLPLGLTGGIIGEFFLPFGLAVTYALGASFVIAVTVVPLLALLFINKEKLPEASESALERFYVPILRWALRSSWTKTAVLLLAALTFLLGILLFATRPATFLPDLGEPQISTTVELPGGTSILDTNGLVTALEDVLLSEEFGEQIETVQVAVGSGGLSLESFLGGGSVSENQAQITVAVRSQDELDTLTARVREVAESIFGVEHVTVSSASISEQGFGGFALVVSGPPETVEALDQEVLDTLSNVEGLTNVSSSLATVGDVSAETIIRIDRTSAVRYTGELETQNTVGVTQLAKDRLAELLPDELVISEGFETQQQSEGFRQMFVSMLIALIMVFAVLLFTFGSPLHPFDILLSCLVAPVGAAVALTITDRVLGISAMIGLLMLIGIVVTNAVVLIDRVLANKRERGMDTREALIEGGRTRLRPILMTAVATIFALLPLAVGSSEGAIIAEELGTVVIGGLFSSTLLTLVVVPVAFSILDAVQSRFSPNHKRG